MGNGKYKVNVMQIFNVMQLLCKWNVNVNIYIYIYGIGAISGPHGAAASATC